MKKILLLVVALTAVGSVEVEAQQDLDELVRQGGTYMKRGLIRRNNLTPYSGEVVQYGNSDKTYLTQWGTLRRGEWHGMWEASNGAKGRYDNGERCGPWLLRPPLETDDCYYLWNPFRLECPDNPLQTRQYRPC